MAELEKFLEIKVNNEIMEILLNIAIVHNNFLISKRKFILSFKIHNDFLLHFLSIPEVQLHSL